MPEIIPRVAPAPAFMAGAICFLEKIISPRRAPAKGQTRMPMMGVKKMEPIIAPNSAPMMPDFALPNILAPTPPVTLSIINPKASMRASMSHCHQVRVAFPIMPCHNTPAEMNRVPGMKGMMVPIRPRVKRMMVGIQIR